MNPPRCCSPFQTQWPGHQTPAKTAFVSTLFNAAAFHDDEFDTCNIPRPAIFERAVNKRKAEYVAGRACAREALELETGISSVPEIGEDRAPIWPAEAVGTITHSDGWAAALVASRQHYQGLGIDVETVMSADRAHRLIQEILTPNEQRRHASALEADPGQLLTIIFSLKESLFKALYPIVKRRFYFQHAELVGFDNQGQATLRLLTELSPEWHHGREVDAQFTVFDNRILSLVTIPS
ncbi:MAG: 4'-phosphopantetheinyl transferase [Alteromonadaceae bacterium]|nr:4'-phosphopantetheinyl transferase [Alteromonadaceae bacterium]MBH84604.1 4'-phosphopantetheinyl transferase [Alteromonadaceae bacterium]